MIAGLEDISSGELRIGGERVNEKAPKERDIAMVFQNYALYPHMTVRENMGFPLKMAGGRQGEIDRWSRRRHGSSTSPSISTAARQPFRRPAPAGRDGSGDRSRPESLPDGRAALQPRRQAAGADAHRGRRGSSSRLGTTTVYVTHDQTEAMTLGDRVAVMRAGAPPAGRLAGRALRRSEGTSSSPASSVRPQ